MLWLDADIQVLTGYRESNKVSQEDVFVVRDLVDIVVVTRTLTRNGGIAEDYVTAEAGQLPKSWTKGQK